MVVLRQMPLFLVALILASGPAFASSSREERAYAAAASAFQDGLWSRAEVGFAEFAEKYPKSSHIAEAWLLQAEADYKQQKFLQAIALLTSHESQAGQLADQYVYWLGQARFQNGNYAAAAAAFARLAHDFPDSHWQLDGVVNEASARAKLDQWPQVIALLREPGGAFQRDAKKNPADERVVRGQLLLAEALLRQNKLNEATAVLHVLASQKLSPELGWQQTRLLCRAQLASGDTNAALASATNLIRLADATGQVEMRAASVVEQGNVLEQMGRDDQALAVYRENLSTNIPADWQQQAILKIAGLAATQEDFSEAAQSLEQFLKRFPGSPSADIAQLTLGELHLKEYVAQPAVATNGLQEAEAQFHQFLDTHTNSPLRGKAYLDEGWCFWVEKKYPDSLAAFKTAAQLLPPSADQAVARFKMGDVFFRQGDFADARYNYEMVWQNFTNFPAVAETLAPQALYQSLRASLKLKDVASASNALARILTIYPTSGLTDKSILLVGKGLADIGQPASARALFLKFEELSPTNSMRPEVELALARTYEQENNWSAAIGVYNHWMKQYTNDTKLLPQVEYARAMANYRVGNGTTAFAILTNFVAQFPTNGWAPIAQYWIGGYFFQKGATNNSYYADAEKNYELLFQIWPTNYLAYQAKLMAGRAALGRYSYSDAIQYFTNLTSDTSCPPDIAAKALSAYGGALMQEPSPDTNNPLTNFEQAILVFKAIGQSFPQSEQAALAWGAIGECYFQLAGQPNGAHYYNEATNAYEQVIHSPQARVAARCQAQMGIGLVFEKRAAQATGQARAILLQKALNNYLDVLDTWTGKNLRPGETADPFWVQKAGLEAARVLEMLGKWPQAVNVYRRLEKILPQLHGVLEAKIANAQAHVTPEQN